MPDPSAPPTSNYNSPSSAMADTTPSASLPPPPHSSVLLPFVDPPILSSTLQKRSPAASALWQIRHFILYPDVLLYSLSSSPSSVSAPLGLIPLSSIIYVTALPSSPLRFDFLIQAEKATHTFQLMTTSPALTQQWVRRMKRLTRAGHAGRVEDVWYDRRGKFWKAVHQLAMQRRVRRAQADYAEHHPDVDAAVISQAMHSGWLKKRSPAFLHVWQARYFALYPAVLVYCKAESGGLLGAVALLSVLWMERREDRRLDVAVEDEDGTGVGRERLLQLQMDSDTERDTWHALITQQMSTIKHDHTNHASSASLTHSRSNSDGAHDADAEQEGEEKPEEEHQPARPPSTPFTLVLDKPLARQQHTPYLSSSARQTERPAVPILKHGQLPPASPTPLPASDSTPSPSLLAFPTTTKPPVSPLSVILLSRTLAAQSKPSQPTAPSAPPAPTAVALPSDPSPPSALPRSTDGKLNLPATPMLTRSTSCYATRPTLSYKRPLIKLADTSNTSPQLPPAPSPPFSVPSILATTPGLHNTSRNSRSGSCSSSTSPPPNGLLDDGVLLTLFHFCPSTSTLSFSDRILAYDADHHTIRSRLPDGVDATTHAAQGQLEVDVALDELEGAVIGRASPTLQRLSSHVLDECCLTLSCRTGLEVNVVAKGATIIKLLHRELMAIIEGEEDENGGLQPREEEAEEDDKLDDDARTPQQQQPHASPALLPYEPQLPVFPSLALSVAPSLTRSRSAPVAGATLRFQERIEVHEYVAPASYTPSEEDMAEQRDVDMDDGDAYDDVPRDLHAHIHEPIEEGDEDDDDLDSANAAPLEDQEEVDDGDGGFGADSAAPDAQFMEPLTPSPFKLTPRMEAQEGVVEVADVKADVRAEADVQTDVAAVTQHHPLSHRLSSVIAHMKLPDFSAQGQASALAQRKGKAEAQSAEDEGKAAEAQVVTVEPVSGECVLGRGDDVPQAPPLDLDASATPSWRESRVATPPPPPLAAVICAAANPAAASLAAIFQQRALQQQQRQQAETKAAAADGPPSPPPPPTALALQVVTEASVIPTAPPLTPSPRPPAPAHSSPPSAPPSPSPVSDAKPSLTLPPSPSAASPQSRAASSSPSPSSSSPFGVRLRPAGATRPATLNVALASSSSTPTAPSPVASPRPAARTLAPPDPRADAKLPAAPAVSVTIPSPRGGVYPKPPPSLTIPSPSGATVPDAPFTLPDAPPPSVASSSGSSAASASAVTAAPKLLLRPSWTKPSADIPTAPPLLLDTERPTASPASPAADQSAGVTREGGSDTIRTAPPLSPSLLPKTGPAVSPAFPHMAAPPTAQNPQLMKTTLTPSPSGKAAASPRPSVQSGAAASVPSATPAPSSSSSLSIPSSLALPRSLPASPSLGRAVSSPPAPRAASPSSASGLPSRASLALSPRQSPSSPVKDASVAAGDEDAGDSHSAAVPEPAVPAASRVSALRSMWQHKG